MSSCFFELSCVWKVLPPPRHKVSCPLLSWPRCAQEPPPRGEVVCAADGALVDKCSWCEREGLCVCPHCDANLCAHHFHETDCPGCVRAAKRRRVCGKQPETPKKDGPAASTPVKVETVIVPKEEPNDEAIDPIVLYGGWPKCSHPLCRFRGKTLKFLTGQVRGVPHHSTEARRVCRRCVCIPWPIEADEAAARTQEKLGRHRNKYFRTLPTFNWIGRTGTMTLCRVWWRSTNGQSAIQEDTSNRGKPW